MNTTYSTREEAIEREIVDAIEATGEATRDEYDIDAIADETLEAGDFGTNGSYAYRSAVDADEFWTIVAKHAR